MLRGDAHLRLTRTRSLILSSAVLLATFALLSLAYGGGASVAAHGADGRPARLHEGTCDQLGPVAVELTGVGAETTPDGTPVPPAEAIGPGSAVPVAVSATEIETSLSDIVEGGHALAVAASDDADDDVIACGDVGGRLRMQMGGMVMPGDELIVGLAGSGGSGAVGIAVLRAEGSATVVTVYLVEGATGDA